MDMELPQSPVVLHLVGNLQLFDDACLVMSLHEALCRENALFKMARNQPPPTSATRPKNTKNEREIFPLLPTNVKLTKEKLSTP